MTRRIKNYKIVLTIVGVTNKGCKRLLIADVDIDVFVQLKLFVV